MCAGPGTGSSQVVPELSTPQRDMNDMIEPIDKHDMIEPIDNAEPIDSSEPADPIEPTDRTEPTEPIDNTEPSDAIDSTEFSDHSDHLLVSGAAAIRQDAKGDGNEHCSATAADAHARR